MWFLHPNHSNLLEFHLVLFLELKATFILSYRQFFVGVMLGSYASHREGTFEVGSGVQRSYTVHWLMNWFRLDISISLSQCLSIQCFLNCRQASIHLPDDRCSSSMGHETTDSSMDSDPPVLHRQANMWAGYDWTVTMLFNLALFKTMLMLISLTGIVRNKLFQWIMSFYRAPHVHWEFIVKTINHPKRLWSMWSCLSNATTTYKK